MTGSGGEGPAIGASFAGYRIEALLGEGGMGVVYLARDERLDRPVALKLVAPRLSAEPGFRERFLIESRLAASLDHSHVVPIYEAGEVDGDLYLAMRYVEGTTLRDVLRHDGPLEPARALDICEQVAQALDGAHDRGLVHRDVKPANVLVADEGGREHCYLCDFGLARQTDAVRDDGRFSGTVAYTAPEQISGGSIDGRADQYALACVLCECLTGQPPFPRAPAAAILFAHLSDPPASLHDRRDDLPESIDAAVGRALAKEPDERYATCREFIAEARTALDLDGSRVSRRALLVAASGAVLGVAAAATIPAILLTRNEAAAVSPKPLVPLASDGVLRINPAGEVTDALHVPSANGPITFGEGSVWLADTDRKVVSRIDPGTSAVVDEIDVAENGDPGALAVGEGTLWVFGADWTAKDLSKYDLRTNRWSSVDLEGVSSENLIIAHGALWSVCEQIVRIDVVTGHLDAQIDPGAQGKLVAAGEGAVWFAANKGVGAVPGGSPRVANRPRDEHAGPANRLQRDGCRSRRGRGCGLDADARRRRRPSNRSGDARDL